MTRPQRMSLTMSAIGEKVTWMPLKVASSADARAILKKLSVEKDPAKANGMGKMVL